jgi:hypothetical protein
VIPPPANDKLRHELAQRGNGIRQLSLKSATGGRIFGALSRREWGESPRVRRPALWVYIFKYLK